MRESERERKRERREERERERVPFRLLISCLFPRSHAHTLTRSHDNRQSTIDTIWWCAVACSGLAEEELNNDNQENCERLSREAEVHSNLATRVIDYGDEASTKLIPHRNCVASLSLSLSLALSHTHTHTHTQVVTHPSLLVTGVRGTTVHVLSE